MTRPLAGVALWRWLLLVVGVAALVIAFATKSSSKAATVATVGGQPITIQTFNHWLKSSAIAAHSSSSAIPNFVPDAPAYVRCINFINAAQVKAGKHPSNTTLLTDCKQLRTALAEEVMQLLI
jgi:TRAP-type C4-dicarboxylate transport system permease large subunit